MVDVLAVAGVCLWVCVARTIRRGPVLDVGPSSVSTAALVARADNPLPGHVGGAEAGRLPLDEWERDCD